MRIGEHHERHFMPGFDFRQCCSFLIVEEVDHFSRGLDDDLAGVFLHDLFFDKTHYG